MIRMTRIFIALLMVLNVAATNIGAQSRKGETSAASKATQPKPASSQKGSASPSASAEKQESNSRPNNSGQARELTPEQKRDAAKIQILDLTANPGNSGSVQAKANFKVELPKGIVVKGFDAVFEMRFSNGETRKDNFSIGVDRREVSTTISLPVISRPAFDCSVCLRLDEFEKGEAVALGQQCALNNCPTPPPQPSGGGKDDPKARTLQTSSATQSGKQAGQSSISARSASGGFIFADPISLKLTVTARFADDTRRGEFTKSDTRTQAKFINSKLSK